MIKTKKQLHDCLNADSVNYIKRNSSFLKSFINTLATNPINDQKYIWAYIKELRYNEFYLNNSFLIKEKKFILYKCYYTALLILSNLKLKYLSYKTGFQIPPNVIEEGLTIWHYGYIIINGESCIGNKLTIYPGVEIGHKAPGGKCPIIGNNCFIGAGAKIFGEIHVGNNVTIAPNAVIVKDVPDNCVVAGIPAKIIKYKD